MGAKRGRGKPPRARRLSIDDALRLAVTHHRADRLDDARVLYERVLQAVPNHADALHFYGILRFRMGDADIAERLIRQAIERVPDFPDFRLNLGNILIEMGRPEDAETEYRAALTLRPDFADAWNNLGSIQRHLGHLDDAESSFRRAIELDPSPVRAWNNLGALLAERGDKHAATQCYCEAITLDRAHPEAYRRLGIAWHLLGDRDRARQAFQDWLQADPGNPEALHLLAACENTGAPERASDDYVAYAFDRFAGSFEAQLQGRLAYQAPALVRDRVATAFGPPSADWSVLDAGCGTGLCGPLIKPWSKQLVGIDLSGGMLDQARGKGCYDALEQAELTAWLEAHPDQFDLVISADTLVYFGPLERVLGAAGRALRPGGRLVFTLEHLAGGEAFSIHHSGRYQHATPYVQASLEGAGFEPPLIEPVTPRTEAGLPVPGLLVSTRKA